jgi:predicted amidophosphoribosyltransferase
MDDEQIRTSRRENLMKRNKELCIKCGEPIPKYYPNCPECGHPKEGRAKHG